MNDQAFFRHGPASSFEPLPGAASNWDSGRTVRGMAVSALLARAAEAAVGQQHPGTGLRPARWTVDLAPVTMSGCTVHSTILRAGRRVVLVDCELVQGTSVRARSRGIFVRGEEGRSSGAWAASQALPPLPATTPDQDGTRLYWSESVGWTASAAGHMNGERKQVWQPPVPVVEGEEPSGFQVAAAVADLASLVTLWGVDGLLHINADISMTIARVPSAAGGVGLVAVGRTEHEGVAVGTALMRDRDGEIGTSVVCSLSGRDRVVDPRARDT